MSDIEIEPVVARTVDWGTDGATLTVTDQTAFAFAFPKAQSRLCIGRDCITIDTPKKRPCWWIRFWYKLLLGWTWEKL